MHLYSSPIVRIIHSLPFADLFKSTEECRKSNAPKESELTIKHTMKNGKSVTFRVIDNPHKVQWSNVVAVIASGQQWQFKGWSVEEPVKIFNDAKGFYVKYSDGAIDPSVKNWNVTILEVPF